MSSFYCLCRRPPGKADEFAWLMHILVAGYFNLMNSTNMLNIFVGAFFLIQWKTDSGARLCILHVPVFEYKVLSVIVYKVCSYVVVVFNSFNTLVFV